MLEQIHKVKPKDYEKLMSFLEKSYKHPKGYFQAHYPHVWRKETIQFQNRYVIEKDKKILSHVGIFPLDIIANRDKIKAAGVGGVATDPDYRGRGFMTQLLNAAIDDMKKSGFPISVLWGDRKRYKHFGYELTGREIQFTVTKRSIYKKMDSQSPVEIVEYKSEEYLLEKIIELHKKCPLYVKRTKNDYLLLMKKPNIKVILGNNKQNWAYLVIENSNREEL